MLTDSGYILFWKNVCDPDQLASCFVSLSKSFQPPLLNTGSPQENVPWWLKNCWCKTGLSPPVKYFTDRSKAVLLLWIFYVFVLSCVCYVFVRVCLYVLCGHLLGKDWPLGSRLWCLTVSLSLFHWYPGSGVVLDCIDSWSLHPYLLWLGSQLSTQLNVLHSSLVFI